MKTYIQQIELFLSKGETEKVFPLLKKLSESYPGLRTPWTLLSGRYHKNEEDFAMGLLERNQYDTEHNKIRSSIFQMISKNYDEWKDLSLPREEPKETHSLKDVFISYSHKNTEMAMKVKTRLEEAGLSVKIDDYDMHPGINVYEYIQQAIKNSHFTLSIISPESLFSTWVAMETLGTFRYESTNEQERFIPCYLDRAFMDIEFTVRAVQKIDSDLAIMERIIKDQNALRIDTRNLNDEKSRLYELRSNLDEIIGRLKRTKCMNLSEPYFEENMKKVIHRIKTKHL